MESPTTNIRYVVAGTPVGWAAMAKTLRDVDEDKIRDCKEDIDTLLVFAGLFSAVMTAFLVESYKNLQEDERATSVALLRQIALQTNSYTVSSTSINSTVALPASLLSTDFEPSLAAIRVNVLWFAALIFSLTTASFGILVKQWLREYLAGEYTSGQARLRVRQFRHPGLADWRVFEIAALLPLLLQLSLGLFLLGLCFFTYSVHPSVGLTSTPLVAGWALLFVLCTFAPVVSPRCPFKTTLTKRAVKALRRLLWSVPPLGHVLHSFQRRHDMPKPGSTFASAGSASVVGASEKRPPLYEEEDAAKDERQDLDILSSVDSILQDDDLLGTTMLESMQQAQFDPSEVVDFTFGALQRRIPPQYNLRLAATPPSSLLNLRKLRKQGWEAIVDILADTVAKGLSEPTHILYFPPWLSNALLILLSFQDNPLTPIGNRVLSLCLAGPEVRECTAQVIAGRTAPQYPGNLAYVLRRLRPAFMLLAPGDVVWSVLAILHRTVCINHQHSSDQLVEFFREHASNRLPGGVMQAVLEILADCVNRELSSSTDPGSSWSVWARHALRALLSCDVPPDSRHDVSRLICTLTRRPNTTYGTLLNVIALNKGDRASELPALCTFKNAFTDSDLAERRSILNNMISTTDQFVKGTLSQDTPISMNPVRMWRLGLYMLQGQHNRDELQEEWRAFWCGTANAMKEFTLSEVDVGEQQILVNECLSLLELLDSGPEDQKLSYASWLETFNLETTSFPDELFEQVDLFVPGEDGAKHRRIRRLRETRQAEGAQLDRAR